MKRRSQEPDGTEEEQQPILPSAPPAIGPNSLVNVSALLNEAEEEANRAAERERVQLW